MAQNISMFSCFVLFITRLTQALAHPVRKRSQHENWKRFLLIEKSHQSSLVMKNTSYTVKNSPESDLGCFFIARTSWYTWLEASIMMLWFFFGFFKDVLIHSKKWQKRRRNGVGGGELFWILLFNSVLDQVENVLLRCHLILIFGPKNRFLNKNSTYNT